MLFGRLWVVTCSCVVWAREVEHGSGGGGGVVGYVGPLGVGAEAGSFTLMPVCVGDEMKLVVVEDVLRGVCGVSRQTVDESEHTRARRSVGPTPRGSQASCRARLCRFCRYQLLLGDFLDVVWLFGMCMVL